MKEIKEECWLAAKYIKDDGSVLDFTGLYEVSDQGRVRSLNYRRTGKTKELRQGTFECKDGTMYYQVTLRKDNKRHILPTHRLVLSSFKEREFFTNAVANHKVERTATSCINELSNLEWITYKDNVNTEHRKELQSKAMTNHPSRSKRVRVTNLATNETTVYPSAKEAGRSLGINSRTPAMCINQSKGFHKKLGLHFEYV